MAKQIITKLLDDLDGEVADETVTFSLDGSAYDIDLSGPHALELREFLSRFIEAGRRVGRAEYGRSAQLTRYSQPALVNTAEQRAENQAIREWAVNHGWPLADRGRIPTMIMEAYASKTPNPEWAAAQKAQQAAEALAAEDQQAAEKSPGRKPRGRTAPAFAG